MTIQTDRLESTAAALRRVAQFLNSRSWALKSTLDLTPTQQKLLRIFSRGPAGLSLTFVARQLGITPATASDSVVSLERKGLVRREVSQQDGRKLALSLTDLGRDRYSMLASRPDPLQAILASLPESQQKEFHTLTLEVVRCLEEAGHLPAPAASQAIANESERRFEQAFTPPST